MKSRWSRTDSCYLVIALSMLVIICACLVSNGIAAGKARHRKADIQIYGLSVAFDNFKADNGYYPAGTNGLRDLIEKPAGANSWHPYYICLNNTIPLDPWGHPYLYEYPGKHRTNSYDLSSAGPDGKFGTEDDIANWQSPKP